MDRQAFQPDGTAAGARKRLDTMLGLQIDAIDRACNLTEAQKQKLQLAGRGDIKRFFSRFEDAKRRFQLVKNDPNMAQGIHMEIQPLQITLQAGLFHDTSLFAKSLRNTLSDEQFASYEALRRERQTFHHRAQVELAIALLEQSMPLESKRRRELVSFLLKETKPITKRSQYDNYVMFIQLGRIPEAKLRPHFDAVQWKTMERFMMQYRGVEPFLKQNGLWPDDLGVAGGKDARPPEVINERG